MPMTAALGPDLCPFDPPAPGETLVLLAAGESKGCYSVGCGRERYSLRKCCCSPILMAGLGERIEMTPEVNPSTGLIQITRGGGEMTLRYICVQEASEKEFVNNVL